MNVRLYLRHVLVLLTGSAAAQIINLASYPILTRLYTPADFGVFALFLTITGILGPIAAGRFDLIVQSASDREIGAVFRLSQSVNLFVSVAATALVAAYAWLFGGFAPVYALLVGPVVYMSGFTLAATALLIRNERYGATANAVVVRTLATALLQVLLFFVWPTAFSLALGFAIGFLGQVILLVRALRVHPRRRATRRHFLGIWTRRRWQVLIDVPSTLLGALVLNILTFFLLALYSTREVGFYALAFRVAVLPLSLLGGSLSEVFFQKAAASYRSTGTFWNELRFNLGTSFLLSVAVFVPMGLLARPVFDFVFGEEWAVAAEILVYLLPMLAVRFVSSSVQTAPLVLGRPHWLLAQNVALLAAMGFSFFLASSLSLGLGSYMLVNSLLMAIVYAGFVLFVAARVHRRYRIVRTES